MNETSFAKFEMMLGQSYFIYYMCVRYGGGGISVEKPEEEVT